MLILWVFLLFGYLNLDGQSTELGLIPWPKNVTQNNGEFKLTSSSRIVYTNTSLQSLANIIKTDIQRHTGLNLSVSSGTANAGDIELRINNGLQSEGYTLNVDTKIVVSGKDYRATVWGTSTLLQAISVDGAIRKMQVNDSPDANYRGLLVDLARNWHTIKDLEEIINMCRLYKVNYLQLHLTDDQSFTFTSKAFPNLATPGKSYSLAELNALETYSQDRGVTIVPELDVPGHAKSMVNAYPNLFGSANKSNVINFARPEVVAAVGTLIKELSDVFKATPYIHIGGDEVDFAGLDTNPEFVDAINKNNLGNIHGLFNYFINQMNAYVKAEGKTTLVWEGFDSKRTGNAEMDNDIIVCPFDNHTSANTYAENGHNILNTSWFPLYLIPSTYVPIQKIYEWNITEFGNYTDPFPRTHNSTKQYTFNDTNKLIGAQTCSWEQPAAFEIPSLRGRISTMCERIWNQNSGKSFTDYMTRLEKSDVVLSSMLETVVPEAVTPSASYDVYSDKIVIRWRASTGYPRDYTLYRGTSDNSANATPILTNTKLTVYEDTNVANGQTYYYWVKANNTIGSSPFGNSADGRKGNITQSKAYEPFDYNTNASFSSLSGGSGFSGGWTITTDNGSPTVNPASLTYPGLQTSGKSLSLDMSGASNTFRADRTLSGSFSPEGSEVWVSFLIKANKVTNGHFYITLGDNSIGKPWGNGLAIFGALNAQLKIVNGETNLIVMKIESFNGNDDIHVWTNPVVNGSVPSFNDANHYFTDRADFKIKPRIGFTLQHHGEGNYQVDELRVGISHLDVIPNATTNPPTPTDCEVAIIPGKIEAESHCRENGTFKETTTDAGGGQNIGGIAIGDWMEYTVNVQKTGDYKVNYRVASAESTGGAIQLQIKENGIGRSIGNISLPGTGGWQNFTTVSNVVKLTQGEHILRVQATGPAWNLNWFSFEESGAVVVDCNTFKVQTTADQYYCQFESGTQNFSANATGGTAPYTYEWSNGLGRGQNKTSGSTATSTFTVTATDANGCTATDDITIFIEKPTVETTADQYYCQYEPGTQNFSANATGGTAPYTYEWSNGLGRGQYKNSGSTETSTFTVTVTDANGCTATDDITIFIDDQYCPAPSCTVAGGTLTGGPFNFCVGDGTADYISNGAVTLSGNKGTNNQWLVTDEAGKILGLLSSYTADNFDGAGPGICLIWHLSYENGLQGLSTGNNVNQLSGCFELSNSITINRQTCSSYDCPVLQANIGATCNDGNPNTTNDKINGNCQCAGAITSTSGQTTESCDGGTTITYGDGSITMTGGSFYQIFDLQWKEEFACGWQCGNSQTANNLPAGEYRVFIKGNNYQVICEKIITLTGSGPVDPPTNQCTANAGTLTSVNPTQELTTTDEAVILRANVAQNPTIPAGYSVVYILTSTDNLVIQEISTNARFTVSQAGKYRIHTFVYDPSTIDLSIIVPTLTTGVDVNNILIQGGGSICASLDVTGAIFNVTASSNNGITTESCGNGTSISYGNGTISMSGADFYHISDTQCNELFACGWQCGTTQIVDNLPAGEYHILMRNDEYEIICEQIITLTGGNTTNPNPSTSTTTVCEEVSITYGNGTIDMEGTAGKSYFFKINDLDNGWNQVFGCSWECGNQQTATNLPNGKYLITISNSDWSKHCDVEIEMTNSSFTQSEVGSSSRNRVTTSNQLIESSKDLEQVTLYPNPAQDELNIYLKPLMGKKVGIRLMNTFGQTIYSSEIEKVSNETIQIALDNKLTSGFYQVYLDVDGQFPITQKLIIKK